MTTVTLADGRIIDVFPNGTVQVYTADKRNGYEITLPRIVSRIDLAKPDLAGDAVPEYGQIFTNRL